MIFVKKLSPPKAFSPERVESLTKKAVSFFHEPMTKRRQSRFDFGAVMPSKELKSYLAVEFNSKCVYCESHIDVTELGDHESFRPRRNANGINSEFSEDHYWWLAYEWQNIYYSCHTCNASKQSFFPVEGKRCRIQAPYKEVLEEGNLLIDPCNEDPERSIKYNRDGMAIPLNERAKITIDIIKLNRKQLVSQRRTALAMLILSLKDIKRSRGLIEDITNNPKSERPYLGILRWYLREKKLASPIQTSLAKELDTKIEERINVIVESIEVRNFKAIEHLKARIFNEVIEESVTPTKYPWLMLLGENGVGKSTFLQALTLALSGQKYIDALGKAPSDILRHGCEYGYVKVFLYGDKEPIEMRFSRTNKKIICSIPDALTYVLAYGSTRLPPIGAMKPETSDGKVHALNLFRHDIALADASQWIVEKYKSGEKSPEDKKLFDWVGQSIKDLLELGNNEKLDVRDDKVVITYKGRNHSVSLEDLSDGYKSVVSLTVDVVKTLLSGKTTIDTAKGVVIIDEIGTHLHPKWRMRIVQSLRNVFPLVQFIVTTHDPLCLRGLKKEEVAVLSKNRNHKIHIRTDLPNPNTMNIEQLLGSDFFSLSNTLDPKTESQYNEYYLLLGKKTLTKSDKARLEQLTNLIQQKQTIGNSRYEQLMHKVVHEQIAELKNKPLKASIGLETETVKKIKNLLKKKL